MVLVKDRSTPYEELQKVSYKLEAGKLYYIDAQQDGTRGEANMPA